MQIESNIAEQFKEGSLIVLLDDVLTSGAHFTAARRRILEIFPNVTVIGIFWAKAVSEDNFVETLVQQAFRRVKWAKHL